MWMQRWSNSTRAGQAAIPDSRRPDFRIGRARVVLADAGERLIFVTEKDGWPHVAAGRVFHRRRSTQQRLQPRVFEHHADGPGERGIRAGRHVQGTSTLPPSMS